MSKVHRVTGFHQGTIAAPVDEIWALVNDWGTLHWFDDGSNSEGMKVVECWLEGDPDVVPRTRVMGRGDGAVQLGAPANNREVLLVSDAVAHRLYYDATDGFSAGIRNYIASWSFDVIDENSCLMTISSNFDVVPAELGEEQGAMLHQVYVAIAASLDSYFKKPKQ